MLESLVQLYFAEPFQMQGNIKWSNITKIHALPISADKIGRPGLSSE